MGIPGEKTGLLESSRRCLTFFSWDLEFRISRSQKILSDVRIIFRLCLLMMPLRRTLGINYHGDAAESECSPYSILPNITFQNSDINEEDAKQECRVTRSASTLATSHKSIEDDQWHRNSEGSWSDIKILQYLINECRSPEELLVDEQRQKRREKNEKQRHNNIRHRQRKQLQKRHLKLIVKDLETKLQMLQDTSYMRLYIHRPNQWEELMKAEKQKRERAEEEFQMLHNWIDAHDKLIQLYHRPNNSI